MAEHNELGKSGERSARGYLEKEGYTILETNWRFGRDELDIIAQIGNELIIIEVKTRESNFFGDPSQFVRKSKQRNIIRAANAYVESEDIDLDVRFDIIGVIAKGSQVEIDHLTDAFQPTW